MRYRIVIELATEQDRAFVNKIASGLFNAINSSLAQPVFCSTEVVDTQQIGIIQSGLDTSMQQ